MMGNLPESLAGAEVCDIGLGEEEFVFHGEWLTEARVEEIAEQVFGRAANLIPGGKSLSGGTHRSCKHEFANTREQSSKQSPRLAE
ncbi:MAG: hypothetical protein QOJ20_575 [Mycobacterium sp.]|jgi:hypothetical protein|nr:hypothetical protein [Mycobacterium sp.]